MLVKNKVNKNEIYPFVSIIISAYNEENNIRLKLKSSLELDYPREKFEIIVASDGSTDRTNQIVGEFKSPVVRLLSFSERKGKTFVQNKAAAVAKGEILFFSDATTRFDPEVVKKIVPNFSDIKVGAVGGELIYVNKGNTETGAASGLYWRYEKFIKSKESLITSLIGVSGCCYAVRKGLYEPISPDLISDFVVAQVIYSKGKRVIYESEALSYEDTNNEARDEFKMRVRIAVRTLYGLWNMRGLLNPLKYGFFSIQLFSHKILRYFVPIFLILLLIVNVVLLKQMFYRFAFTLQVGFYLLAFLGGVFRPRNRYLYIPFYFCFTNFALLEGLWDFLLGKEYITWSPLRK